jgi:hypothetical protein
MPKRSTSKPGDEPTEPVAAAEPEATEATETAGATETAEVDADAAEEAPEFENRAARRARGKGTNQPQPHAEQSHFARRGSVQTPRQYGRRRSG